LAKLFKGRNVQDPEIIKLLRHAHHFDLEPDNSPLFKLFWLKYFEKTKKHWHDRTFTERINGHLITLLAAVTRQALYLQKLELRSKISRTSRMAAGRPSHGKKKMVKSAAGPAKSAGQAETSRPSVSTEAEERSLRGKKQKKTSHSGLSNDNEPSGSTEERPDLPKWDWYKARRMRSLFEWVWVLH
jgi:hypothetical protein